MPALPTVTKSTSFSNIFITLSPDLMLPATVSIVLPKSMSVKCCNKFFPLCSSSFGSLNESQSDISKKSILFKAISSSHTSFISPSFNPNPSGESRTPKTKSLPQSFLMPSTISKIILDLFSLEPPYSS